MLGVLDVDEKFRTKRGEEGAGKASVGKYGVNSRSAAGGYGAVLESVLHLAIWKISDWKSRRWLHAEGMAD